MDISDYKFRAVNWLTMVTTTDEEAGSLLSKW